MLLIPPYVYERKPHIILPSIWILIYTHAQGVSGGGKKKWWHSNMKCADWFYYQLCSIFSWLGSLRATFIYVDEMTFASYINVMAWKKGRLVLCFAKTETNEDVDVHLRAFRLPQYWQSLFELYFYTKSILSPWGKVSAKMLLFIEKLYQLMGFFFILNLREYNRIIRNKLTTPKCVHFSHWLTTKVLLKVFTISYTCFLMYYTSHLHQKLFNTADLTLSKVKRNMFLLECINFKRLWSTNALHFH